MWGDHINHAYPAMDYRLSSNVGLSSNVANRQDFKNFGGNRSEKPDIVCVQE